MGAIDAALDCRPYAGTYKDFSVNNQVLVPTGSPTLRSAKELGVYGLNGTSEYFSIGDDTKTAFTGSYTLCVLFRSQGSLIGGQSLISRSDDSFHKGYALRILADGKVELRHTVQGFSEGGVIEGAAVSVLTNYDNGQWYFLIGEYVLNTSQTIYVDDVQLTQVTRWVDPIVSYPSGFAIGKQAASSDQYFRGEIGMVKCFGRALDADERTAEFEETRRLTFRKNKTFVQMPPEVPKDSSLLVDFDFGNKSATQILDRSGNANHGTIVSMQETRMENGRPALTFLAPDEITLTDLGDPSACSISCWLNLTGIDTSTQAFVSCGSFANSGIILGVINNTLFFYTVCTGGLEGTASTIAINHLTEDTFVCGSFNGTDERKVFFGSEKVYTNSTNVGGLKYLAPDVYYVGKTDTPATSRFMGTIRDVKIWNAGLSDDYIEQLHRKESGYILLKDDFGEYYTHTANVSDAYIYGSNWFAETGNWRVVDDDIRFQKHLKCISAGVLHNGNKKAYATYEFTLKKGGAATVPTVLFIASEIGGTTASGQDGYALRINNDESVELVESAAGVENSLMKSAASVIAADTWYTFRVVRRISDSRFYVYIKGGAFVEWTAITAATGSNPVIDSTTTTSKYIVFDLDNNDLIRDVQILGGEIYP